MERFRETAPGTKIDARRKETIERGFADAKEKQKTKPQFFPKPGFFERLKCGC